MSNYRQTSVEGESWVRTNRIVIENALGADPAATYIRERAVSVGGEVITRPLDQFAVVYDADSESETFELRHPLTGDLIGTMTKGELKMVIHSIGLHEMQQRDAAQP